MLIPFTTARSRSCRRCGRSTYVPVDARRFCSASVVHIVCVDGPGFALVAVHLRAALLVHHPLQINGVLLRMNAFNSIRSG